eukprot:CAMPEP_0176348730 /NCGR_PEP_ID=MMETSP0126-20121128/8104_1 /TAXON_ID=141414 ORGANISM="Strombidinopsis acuminatum, Strain SPMC142" /NCGR_SAMPLE_ID=MMETSP0126 /ASSEMBLY_ACC=CAM_ASM_000229 /LENGTH=32 /DNA_ID= /DNA_START= /DNA_END= /DNA_ORIENTATION=
MELLQERNANNNKDLEIEDLKETVKQVEENNK